MINVLFGNVEFNLDLGLPCRLEDYAGTGIYSDLGPIYEALQQHRGFDNFVRASKLPRVDYYVPEQNLIIEFDESQHFTMPRDISLGLYPIGYNPGFPIEKWRGLCQKLDSHDNDPPFRDEQRAWYDTLRDFAPRYMGKGQIYRLFSRDLALCSLDTNKESDIALFKCVLTGVSNG